MKKGYRQQFISQSFSQILFIPNVATTLLLIFHVIHVLIEAKIRSILFFIYHFPCAFLHTSTPIWTVYYEETCVLLRSAGNSCRDWSLQMSSVWNMYRPSASIDYNDDWKRSKTYSVKPIYYPLYFERQVYSSYSVSNVTDVWAG